LGIGSFDPEIPIASDEPGTETHVADRQLLHEVSRAIERLPVRLREALVLVAVEGRSHREVSQLLGVTEKTVEMRVYRARQRLREKNSDMFEA